jgi:GH43 family beta-xylosidase
MEYSELNGANEIYLVSPGGVPYRFSIKINENFGNQFSFEVAGSDVRNVYHLQERSHSSYLDFFEKLGNDFGTRIPQNRKAVSAPAFKANYREVLKENLDTGILYGYGDPAVISVGEKDDRLYYLVATSNDAPNSFPLLRSKDLADWEFVQYIFPEGQKPLWAADGEIISDYWAPEMHKIGNEFRIYFVARDKHTSELCIGMAKSSHPEQPFRAEPNPILKGNIIDPHVFVEDNNNAYLYWKEDNNDIWPGKLLDLLYDHTHYLPILFTAKEDQLTASFVITLWPWAKNLPPMERFQVIQVFIEAVTSRYANFYNDLKDLSNNSPANNEAINVVLHFMKTPMYAQQLTKDGTALTGERIKIIENDLAWEAHLVEGMWVTEHNRKYYLFYAGNDFSTDQYGIGVAIANSPLGPFEKLPNQLLQSSVDWLAPGHPSVVIGPDGLHHMFLHAYYPGEAGYKKFRVLLSIPVILQEDNVLLHS